MTGWGDRAAGGDQPGESGPSTYSGPPPTAPPPGDPYGNPYAHWSPYPNAAPPPYPYPGGSARPGPILAAAVLGYVCAGLLIISGILLFFGASFISGFDGDEARNLTAEFVVAGLVDLLAAGLFIGGGVAMTGRSNSGRALYDVAGGIVVVAAAYWVARWTHSSGGTVIPYALVFATLAVVGMALAATNQCTQWLRGTPRR